MIKILQADYLGGFQVRLAFADGAVGLYDAHALLERQGPLLEPLRDEAYFGRLFVEAGALCWPNGLELAPEPLRLQCRIEQQAA